MKNILKVYKDALGIKNPLKFWKYSEVQYNPENYKILYDRFIEIIDGKQEMLDAYKMVCENKTNLKFNMDESSLLLSIVAVFFSILSEEQKMATNIELIGLLILVGILVITILLLKQNIIERMYTQILYVLNQIHI